MTRTRGSRFFAIAIAFAIGIFLPKLVSYAATKQNSARASFAAKATPSQSSIQLKLSDDDLAAIANRVATLVKNEVTKDTRAARSDVNEQAQETQDRADRLQSLIAWVSSGWLVVVTILFAIILFFGWQEGRAIRATKQEADGLLQEARAARIQVAQSGEAAREASAQAARSGEHIKSLEGEVLKASDRISATDRAVASSVDTLVADMPALIEIVRNLIEKSLVYEKTPLPRLDVVKQFEEGDVLTVVAYNNNSIEKSKLAKPFTALGYYWRLVENYPRAIARFRRALEIDPSEIQAYRGLSGTLYNLAADVARDPLESEQFLDEAEKLCKRALEIASSDSGVLFDLGWVLDERKNYEGAVSILRKAQSLDPEQKRPNISYNLACSLSKWGKPHLNEAIDELKKVIDKDNNRKRAAVDPDFQNLREDPDINAVFDTLTSEVSSGRF
jgi:tetratricopeptide (TPR) repeat protein